MGDYYILHIDPSQLETLFGFRNLVNYSLHMQGILWDINGETLALLEVLVTNCPNLESLALTFYFDDSELEITTYNLDLLPDLFGQDLTMPHLHTNVDVDIGSLIGPPTTGSYLF
ncbi:unnamed protein product, partial [Rhizoctonia solani]